MWCACAVALSALYPIYCTVCLRRVSSFKVVDTRYGHISYCKIMVTFRKVCIWSHNIHVVAQTCTLGPQWVRDGRGQWYTLSAGCNQTWWSSQVTQGNSSGQGSDRNTTKLKLSVVLQSPWLGYSSYDCQQ